MIITRIYGGLGNQLFQYAYAKALSLELNTELYLETSFYKNEIDTRNLNLPDKRSYLLKNFNINKRDSFSSQFLMLFIKTITKIKNCSIVNKYKLLRRVFNLLISNRFWLVHFEDEKNTIKEISYKKLIIADGYWQDYNYFEKYKDLIKNELTLKNRLTIKNQKYLKKIISSNSVSVHFRRGDALKPYSKKRYAICSMDYYYNSISFIKEKVKNPVFFVFSDGIQWVKSNLKTEFPTIFIDNSGPDYEHLFLMSKCRHNIIANSTFSWWGAWLNENPNKIVIGPQKWTVNDNEYFAAIPESWLKFEN